MPVNFPGSSQKGEPFFESPIQTIPRDVVINHFFNSLKIRDILNMSETSKHFNEMTKDSVVWKKLASQIGILYLGNTTGVDIQKQIIDISVISKRLKLSNADSFTVQNLKNNLNQIKCNNFLKVWRKICEGDYPLFIANHFPLTIPKEAKSRQDSNELDKRLASWIKENKITLLNYSIMCLKNLDISFLPKSIGHLPNLQWIIRSNNLIHCLREKKKNTTKDLIQIKSSEISYKKFCMGLSAIIVIISSIAIPLLLDSNNNV